MTVVCVTGASSYLGTHIVTRLLSQTSHIINATARTLSHPHLSCLSSHKNASQLRFFRADLATTSSFKPAFAGCDVVIHTATPVLVSHQGELPFVSYADFEQKQLQPAVDGVRELLHIAKDVGVKRFVLTGSSAAVIGHLQPPDVLHEGVWSDEQFLKENVMTVPDFGYLLSKLLQEREAVQVAKELNIELAVLLPAFVFGPSVTGIPQSTMYLLQSMITGKGVGMNRCEPGNMPDWSGPFVDVRDVAEAHVNAALMKEVPLERYLLVTEHKHCEDMHRVAKSIVPDKVCKGVVEWKKEEEDGWKKMTIQNYSNKRMKQLLGREPMAWETTIGDAVRQMEENGHL